MSIPPTEKVLARMIGFARSSQAKRRAGYGTKFAFGDFKEDLMPHIAVLGAGITGVTTAFKLLDRGFDVTVIDRQSYPAMETSFANGGQLSASNAEVWNSLGTVLKGMKWLFKKDAPLSMNLSPSWHKYSWLAEFVAAIPNHDCNSIDTARMAIQAREHLLDMAARANVDFNIEHRGILHIYKDQAELDAGRRATALLAKGGVDRVEMTSAEIRAKEPTLGGDIIGGFFTQSDFTGDIHKFTNGLAADIQVRGGQFLLNTSVEKLTALEASVRVDVKTDGISDQLEFDGVVISAGVGSRDMAAQVGDRVNIYPVKGYSITVNMPDELSQQSAPWVSLLDEKAKIVTSRLGDSRFRVAGTAEFNGFNYDIREDRIRPLIKWVRDNFAGVNTRDVTKWAGLRPMMPNMMPRLGSGRNPRVFYNTGHGHLGWTLSAATADITAGHVDQAFASSERRIFGQMAIAAE